MGSMRAAAFSESWKTTMAPGRVLIINSLKQFSGDLLESKSPLSTSHMMMFVLD
jgi:hypothetical protein